MENSEEVLQILERFTKLKPKDIPKELDDYLGYVAKTGDTVYRWSHVKYLFREKLIRVIKDFHETTPSIEDLPQYPNVDPFNYESMKSALLERLELFSAAPFTVQRLCELLTDPRKQYSRIDKFMRALEKNILVVSTVEPGRKPVESENGDSLDSVVNGDLSLDVNVEIDMEGESIFSVETSANPNTNKSETAEQNPTETETKKDSIEDNENEDKKKESEQLETKNTETATDGEVEADVREEKSSTELSAQDVKESENLSDGEQQTDEGKPTEEVAESPKDVDPTPKEKETETSEDSTDSNKLVAPESDEANNSEIKPASPVATTEQTDREEEHKPEIVENETTSPTTDPKEQETAEPQKEEQPEPESSVPPEQAPSTETNTPIQEEDKTTENPCEFEPQSSGVIDETAPSVENVELKSNKAQEQMAIEETTTTSPVEPPCTAILQPITEATVPQTIPDQPMDENLETPPQPEIAPIVDEVVMQSETEMATDTDVGKGEAAVMDIDDTSQEEAMDQ